jgi:hypothetical protein
MKNKELFTLNPDENNLINDGVVEISTTKDFQGLRIIRHELKTFVCEGEYQRGLFRMLDTYLKHFDQPKQPAVWVSGFFGSGKSHLIKMLGYLWEDYQFPNGDTARTIKSLPPDISDLFIELSRKQKIHGRLSIKGTLKDFPSPDIRYSFLKLFLNALDLPQLYHHFKFLYWAKQEGIYNDLKALVEAQGKDFKTEYENLFVSSALAKAILQIRPEFAENEAKVKENFKANFKSVDRLGKEEFVRAIKNEILPMSGYDQLPLTVIVIDEVQQFIGQEADKALDIQMLAEMISSEFDGKFLLVCSGQSALTETENLQKLQDRFTVKIQLSDTDVETVTRKTVLEKKPSAINEIGKKMDNSLGEISRNLAGTDFGYRTDDNSTLVADYPILPSTRKFWKKILQSIDSAQTSGQLRSQLRIVDECIKQVAEKDLGLVVPADFIFEQKESQLLQNALLLNETNNLIQSRKALGGDSMLEGRILSVVFLIDQLPGDLPGGRLRSDENTIADLMLDDLNSSSDVFRLKIKGLIAKLVEEQVLMPIGNEVKLQTRIGSEWEQEYISSTIKLNNSGEDQIQQLRKDRIFGFFKEKTRGINILQGISKQRREFDIWVGTKRPNIENKLNLWVRDGWMENESAVLNEIRAEGLESPLAFGFVTRFREQDLRHDIIRYLAANLTLDKKGIPSSPEGQQAQKSMETRRSMANKAIDEIIDKICSNGFIYLAGGNKIDSGSIRENAEDALKSIADRQFPDFKGKADFKDWDKALNKALVGDPDALKKIGYDKEAKDHPVAVEILRFLGSNTKPGKEIRAHFMKATYGWSQDAIDTIILMLKNNGDISTLEPNLNQAKIGTATFKKEAHTLTARNKIDLKLFYQVAGIQCKPGEEFLQSNTFLNKLRELAKIISGDAPKPATINIQFIKDIENLDGNERLLRILLEVGDLKGKYLEWNEKAALVAKREPQWNLLTELANMAPAKSEMDEIVREIRAISINRLLLHHPDPVQPLMTNLSEKLKNELNILKENYIRIYDEQMLALQANEYFSKIKPDEKRAILARHQILGQPEIKPLDPAGLLNTFKKISLDGWQTKIAALTGQFQSAIDEAIVQAAPQARSFNLPRKTINSQADIDTYVKELKTELENLLHESSSIILK